MLTTANCDLHLGNNIPIIFGPINQIAVGDELHHGREQATQSVVFRETLAERRPPENSLRSDVGMPRQTGAKLKLQKSIRGEKLIESSEHFKCSRAAAERAGSVSAM